MAHAGLWRDYRKVERFHQQTEFLDKSQKATLRWLILSWVCPASAGAEHVSVIAHAIVRHEQLTGEDLVIEETANVLLHTT